MNFVNLTPHVLNIVRQDGSVLEIPATGTVARVETERELDVVIDGVEIFETTLGAVIGLPQRTPDTIFIVSAQVAQRTGRSDVVSPGELVRNEAGQVVGCRGLTSIVRLTVSS